MLLKTTWLVFALMPLAEAAAAVVVGAQCGADNCLRALRSPSKIEQARGDCVAWLETVAPPAPITVTDYSTIQSTTFVVVSTTVDNIIEQTATVTVSQTTTVTSSVTTTVSARIGGGQQQKRETEKPVPVYASACSGAARYSSACSCISASVTPTTTTVTVPTTIWQTVSQTSVATKDQLVTVSTVTEAVVATSTVVETVTETVRPFYMRIDDWNGPWYTWVRPYEYYVRVNQDVTKKQVFELRQDGTVWLGDRVWGRSTTQNPLADTRVLTREDLAKAGFEPFNCRLRPDNTLACTISSNPATEWGAIMYPVLNSDKTTRGRDTAWWHGTRQDIEAWVGNQKARVFYITAVATVDN